MFVVKKKKKYIGLFFALVLSDNREPHPQKTPANNNEKQENYPQGSGARQPNGLFLKISSLPSWFQPGLGEMSKGRSVWLASHGHLVPGAWEITLIRLLSPSFSKITSVGGKEVTKVTL